MKYNMKYIIPSSSPGHGLAKYGLAKHLPQTTLRNCTTAPDLQCLNSSRYRDRTK